MRRFVLLPCFALLLITGLDISTGAARAQDDTPSPQENSPHFASLKTYASGDLQPPVMDRLAGGLPQQFPYRMVADARGRLLITDPSLSLIHVFDLKQGKRWQIRGDREHPLVHPTFITVDDEDNIYVSDSWQGLIFVYLPNGHFLRTIGSGYLDLPSGITIDRRHRSLYVADWQRNEIQVYTLDGYLYQVFGDRGSGPGYLSGPLDLAVHNDTLAVLDAGNNRFELFDLLGNFRATRPFGSNRRPTAFTFDTDGNLFYCDMESGGLVAMNQEGKEVADLKGQRSYGQLAPRYDAGGFLSVSTDPLGVILALRPSFQVEAIKLVKEPPHASEPPRTVFEPKL